MVKTQESLEEKLMELRLKKARKIVLKIKSLEDEIKENIPKIRKAGLYSMILGAAISFIGYCDMIYNINNLREEKTVKEFFYDSKKDLAFLLGGLVFAISSWASEYAIEKAYKKRKQKEIKEEDDYGLGGLSGSSN